jgi:hypothetical protein
MSVTHIEQSVSNVLALILILRLLSFKLHRVYRVFCAFLGLELLASAVILVESVMHSAALDYRVTWLAMRPATWVLSLWMVYELLDAILGKFTGILRASRVVLNITFLASIALALLTVKGEFDSFSSANLSLIGKSINAALVLERVISTVALLVLTVILAFILWFPVEMPRNLSVFSFGFVMYFASKTGLLLATSYWMHGVTRTASDLVTFILASCFTYWILFINPAGEKKKVRFGHGWETGEQAHYLMQLEAMNSALIRAGRR